MGRNWLKTGRCCLRKVYSLCKAYASMPDMSRSSIRMRFIDSRSWACLWLGLVLCLLGTAPGFAASNAWMPQQTIQPADFARLLQQPGNKPLVLHVGFHTLYVQSHIAGSEYCGPASAPEGAPKLRQCIRGVSKTRSIVIYCGCCPWQDCPNVRPAFEALHRMGFTRVKVLYISHNLGQDWVRKGYPTKRVE